MDRPSHGETEYNPDWVLPKYDAITEDNWQEYAARGFRVFRPSYDPEDPTAVEIARDMCGIEHVYTGDAYDEEQERPRRDLPGRGIYTSPRGMLNAIEHANPHLRPPAGPEGN